MSEQLSANDKKVKISVIIPVYNTEKYIDACINSVLSQTYNNYEIIIIDDGSTDNSSLLLHEFDIKYDFVKVIRQKNEKLGAARNVGIKHSTGEYILFLDSDDTIKSNTLEELIKIANKNSLDMLVFDSKIKSELDDYEFSDAWYDRKHLGINESKVYTGYDYCNTTGRIGGGVISSCMIFYKREFIINNHLYFLEGVFYEDNHFTAKSYYLAKRIMYTHEKYYIRRLRADSITTEKKSTIHYLSKVIVGKEILSWLIDSDRNVNDIFWKYLISFVENYILNDNYYDINCCADIANTYRDLIDYIWGKADALLSMLSVNGLFVIFDLIKKWNAISGCPYVHETDIKLKIRKLIMQEIDNGKYFVVYGIGKNGKYIANHLKNIDINDGVMFVETRNNGNEKIGNYPVIPLDSLAMERIGRVMISSQKYETDMKSNLYCKYGDVIMKKIISFT